MVRSDHLVTIATRIPAMLRASTKILLTIEVVVCFAPIVLLLVVGVALTPMQSPVAIAEPLDWRSAVSVIGQVACGLIGFATLIYVLGKLFSGHGSISRPTLVCIGAALGALALVPLLLANSVGWKLVGLLPLAVAAHILFLARRMLFSSWRDGIRKAAVAAAVALPLLVIPLLDPSSGSGSTIREHQARWTQGDPERYEYTIQLSGYPSEWRTLAEVLTPKRIQVEHGNVTSARYLWDGGDHHKAGDPAPMEDLWTIDRVFTELLAVEERGGEVNATFNERWHFVEEARATMIDGSNTGWGVEVRDFSAGASAVEAPRPVQRGR
jgi:hypothetical protein